MIKNKLQHIKISNNLFEQKSVQIRQHRTKHIERSSEERYKIKTFIDRREQEQGSNTRQNAVGYFKAPSL